MQQNMHFARSAEDLLPNNRTNVACNAEIEVCHDITVHVTRARKRQADGNAHLFLATFMLALQTTMTMEMQKPQ